MTSARQSGDIIRDRLIAPADPLGYYDTVEQAIQHYANERSAEAIPLFERALKDYPLDGRIWIYYGHALRAANRPKDAIPAFRKGLELTSTWQGISTYYWLARAHFDSGDKEGGYKALETLVFEEPYVRRPDLYNDAAFAAIRDEPRFLKIVGRVDTSKMSRTDGWRTDIDYVVAEIKRVNHKYKAQRFPKEFTDRYNRLKRDVPKLTDDEIFVRLGHMLAPLNQGHLSLALLPETTRTPVKTLPVQLYAFRDGVFVIGSDPAYSDLIGSQIVRIEEKTPAEILAMAEKHASVENPMKIIWGTQNLAILQVLRGLGVARKDQDSVRLTLRTKDGHTVEKVVPSGAFQHPRKMVPPPGVPVPRFLKNVPRQHWFEAIPENDTLYIQLNQVSPAPDETLPQLGLRLRRHLVDNPVKNIILDVRHNNGGNTSSYREFIRTLIAHNATEGNRLYVLIGRGVYSATGNLITDLERMAAPIFIGEASSGFGNQDGDESFVILPYSGVRGWLTSVWWQLSHPWDMRRSMQPHVPVQLTSKDYFEGKDPVLDVALQMTKRP